MIDGAQIIFLLAVAQAAFRQPPGLVDAQIVDHVARPAAAVGGARQPLFGGENAVAAMGGDVAAEIGLVAEQPKAVAHLPFDPDRTAASARRAGGRCNCSGAGARDWAAAGRLAIRQIRAAKAAAIRARMEIRTSISGLSTSTKLWAEIWGSGCGIVRGLPLL